MEFDPPSAAGARESPLAPKRLVSGAWNCRQVERPVEPAWGRCSVCSTALDVNGGSACLLLASAGGAG